MTTIPTRISTNDYNIIREYQRLRKLKTQAMASTQLYRLAWLTYTYFVATDEEKKTGSWYAEPEDYLSKTPIDEMKPEERNIFMRGLGHNAAERLGYNNDVKKMKDDKDKGTGLDDIL